MFILGVFLATFALAVWLVYQIVSHVTNKLVAFLIIIVSLFIFTCAVQAFRKWVNSPKPEEVNRHYRINSY